MLKHQNRPRAGDHRIGYRPLQFWGTSYLSAATRIPVHVFPFAMRHVFLDAHPWLAAFQRFDVSRTTTSLDSCLPHSRCRATFLSIELVAQLL